MINHIVYFGLKVILTWANNFKNGWIIIFESICYSQWFKIPLFISAVIRSAFRTLLNIYDRTFGENNHQNVFIATGHWNYLFYNLKVLCYNLPIFLHWTRMAFQNDLSVFEPFSENSLKRLFIPYALLMHISLLFCTLVHFLWKVLQYLFLV